MGHAALITVFWVLRTQPGPQGRSHTEHSASEDISGVYFISPAPEYLSKHERVAIPTLTQTHRPSGEERRQRAQGTMLWSQTL